MSIRKRRRPTPSLGINPPFNPKTGTFAPLGGPGPTPYCAMMQVAEEDTHSNYVVCRGYDPASRKFYDTLNVAKPYGLRGTYPYAVGNMLPAVKPLTRIGETSGVSATTVGHPADLNEVIDILLDDDGNAVAWLALDTGTGGIIWGVLDGALAAGGSATMSIWELDEGETDWVNHSSDTTENETVYAPPVMRSGSIAAGDWCGCMKDNHGNWRVLWAQCDPP